MAPTQTLGRMNEKMLHGWPLLKSPEHMEAPEISSTSLATDGLMSLFGKRQREFESFRIRPVSEGF